MQLKSYIFILARLKMVVLYGNYQNGRDYSFYMTYEDTDERLPCTCEEAFR